MRKTYYYQYGTTLAGLMRLHDVCPNAFLDYVHDIDLERRSRRRPSSRRRSMRCRGGNSSSPTARASMPRR